MTIFGQEYVDVEKDVVKRVWRVFTVTEPRRLLCTVPWRDALRTWTDAEYRQYPDYLAAVTTCANDPETALTAEEEASALAPEREEMNDVREDETKNVVRVDFEKRRRV